MSTRKIKALIGSHGVQLMTPTLNEKELVIDFIHANYTVFDTRWNPMERRKMEMPVTEFCVEHPDGQSYFIHKNMLPEFITYLEELELMKYSLDVEYRKPYKPAKGKIKISEAAVPRDYQAKIIEFLNKEKLPTRVLPIQTGKGKTFMGLYGSADRAVRTVCVMLPREIPTWINDAKWIYKRGNQGIRVVKGGKQLEELIARAKEGALKDSVIMISNKTLQIFINNWIRTGETVHGVDPTNFYEVLEADIRILDEAHENIHFNFIQDMVMNVNHAWYLSATIQSNDDFKNKLYTTIFPVKDRYVGLDWTKYIDVYAIGYHCRNIEELKYDGTRGYSHLMFEQSIRENNLITAYFGIMKRWVDSAFKKNYQVGQKAMVFFATVEMCDLAAEYLRETYPEFTVTSYTAETPEEHLHTHDIVVSTPQSAGTGKDIKGLRTTLLTVAVGSQERNIQILGRLRDLKDRFPDVTPEFYYLVCLDIFKHIYYHRKKMDMFRGKVRSLKSFNSGIYI